MKRGEIKIDQLHIRLQGGNASDARALGHAIGGQLLEQIVRQANGKDRGRKIRIAQVDAGIVRLNHRSPASVAGESVARQVAGEISSRMRPAAGGRR